MERFARIGAGWIATCIVGGFAAVAAAVLMAKDYLWLALPLALIGLVAIAIGVVGLIADVRDWRHSITKSDSAADAVETDRRRRLVNDLHTAYWREYILSHDGITSRQMAGNEPAPIEWLNAELLRMGENWRARDYYRLVGPIGEPPAEPAPDPGVVMRARAQELAEHGQSLFDRVRAGQAKYQGDAKRWLVSADDFLREQGAPHPDDVVQGPPLVLSNSPQWVEPLANEIDARLALLRGKANRRYGSFRLRLTQEDTI